MKKIMVFSDFSCPFSYVGFSIMKRLRSENHKIEFEFLPYLLNPDLPMEGGYLGDELDQARIQEGFERVEMLGREYGLTYNNKRMRFNTNRLHLASQYAQDKGRFFEFGELAFKYIFELGKNVGKQAIIDEIATEAGLDPLDMNKRLSRGDFQNHLGYSSSLAQKYGVESVPTFIVDGVKKPTHLKPYEDFIRDLMGK